MIKKIEHALKDFAHKMGTEAEETREATAILRKHLGGHELTAEEKKKLREQTYDILKGVGIGLPFMLIPGASIILPLIIAVAKKHGINLMPSSFSE
jgi:uncharacterized membrane protein YukC